MAQRYRKRPIVIEAIQWTGDNLTVVQDFVGVAPFANRDYDFKGTPDCLGFFIQARGLQTVEGGGRLYVAANDNWLDIEIGEWVLKDAKGCYPCKADIFEQTYELVEE